jgi:hypothetical protein
MQKTTIFAPNHPTAYGAWAFGEAPELAGQHSKGCSNKLHH